MATWNVDKPALANQISNDVPDIEENLQELHDLLEHLTTGTLGTTTVTDFNLEFLATAHAADHTASGAIVSLTAGENLVFGNPCYMKSDGKMWKSDADASTTMPVMAMAGAIIAADVAGAFLLLGFARDDSWAWTIGGAIYASTTVGFFSQTAPTGTGDQIQIVGIATHADRIFFSPQKSRSLELQLKVIELGAWDMDTDGSIDVAHGLTLIKIRTVSIVIVKDGSGEVYPLTYGVAQNEGNWWLKDATLIRVMRTFNGVFDNANFDSTVAPANRGWITIWYVA